MVSGLTPAALAKDPVPRALELLFCTMRSINPGMHSRVKANLESLLTRGRADTRAGAHTRKLTPILGTACTDLNSLCYNSITEQGQMFWIAVHKGGMEASLTCCPCCPFLPEFR